MLILGLTGLRVSIRIQTTRWSESIPSADSNTWCCKRRIKILFWWKMDIREPLASNIADHNHFFSALCCSILEDTWAFQKVNRSELLLFERSPRAGNRNSCSPSEQG